MKGRGDKCAGGLEFEFEPGPTLRFAHFHWKAFNFWVPLGERGMRMRRKEYYSDITLNYIHGHVGPTLYLLYY